QFMGQNGLKRDPGRVRVKRIKLFHRREDSTTSNGSHTRRLTNCALFFWVAPPEVTMRARRGFRISTRWVLGTRKRSRTPLGAPLFPFQPEDRQQERRENGKFH